MIAVFDRNDHEIWRSQNAAEVSVWLSQLRASAQKTNKLEDKIDLASAEAVFDTQAAEISLTSLYRTAQQSRDEILACWVAAIRMDMLYSDWRSTRGQRHWIDSLRPISLNALERLPISLRLDLAAGVLACDLYGEAISSAADVASATLRWAPAAHQAQIRRYGNLLGYALEYWSAQRNWGQADRVVEQFKLTFDDAAREYFSIARFTVRRSFAYDFRRGDYAQALLQANRAIELASNLGLTSIVREAGVNVSLCHLMHGELESAWQAIENESAAAPPGHLMLQANIRYERAWWHALNRDVVKAQHELDEACRMFDLSDEHGVMAKATPSLRAQLFVQLGAYQQALQVLNDRVIWPDTWIVDAELIQSLAAMERGATQQAVEHLRRGLELASRMDIKGIFWACRPECQRLLQLALQHDVQAEWVRAVCLARRFDC